MRKPLTNKQQFAIIGGIMAAILAAALLQPPPTKTPPPHADPKPAAVEPIAGPAEATPETTPAPAQSEAETLDHELRQMSLTVPVPVKELRRIAEIGIEHGIPKKEVVTFTRTIVEFSIVAEMPSEKAAITLIELAKATDTPFNKIPNIASTIVALAKHREQNGVSKSVPLGTLDSQNEPIKDPITDVIPVLTETAIYQVEKPLELHMTPGKNVAISTYILPAQGYFSVKASESRQGRRWYIVELYDGISKSEYLLDSESLRGHRLKFISDTTALSQTAQQPQPNQLYSAAPETAGPVVYVAPYSGLKYHRSPTCRGLGKARGLQQMTEAEAKSLEYEACKICD